METTESTSNDLTLSNSESVKVESKPSSKNKKVSKQQIRDFLFVSITKNKPDIAHFLFDRFDDTLDEIFVDEDGKLHEALIYASAKGYADSVNVILQKGSGRVKQASVEAALDVAGSDSNIKNLLFDRLTLDEESFQRLMLSSIERGDLDSVKALFDKQM